MGDVTIYPTTDSYIYSAGATTNYGTNANLYVGDPAASAHRARSLLKMESLTGIDEGKEITLVEIHLYSNGSGRETTPADSTVYANRLLLNWAEGGVTYNTTDGTNGWSEAGANADGVDRAATASGECTIAATSGWYTITGSGMCDDVYGWVNGTLDNYGWLISWPSVELDATYSVYNRFNSSDAASNPPYVYIEWSDAAAITSTAASTLTGALSAAMAVFNGPATTLSAASTLTQTDPSPMTAASTLSGSLSAAATVDSGSQTGTITVPLSGDTYIYNENPSTNYDTSTWLYVGDPAVDSSSAARSLLRIDESVLPADITITGASVHVYSGGSGRGPVLGGTAATLYRATTDWTDDEATWTNAATATEWTTAGGDYDTAALASVTLSTSNGWYVFSSGNLLDYFNGINSGDISNYGLLLIAPGMEANVYEESYNRFYSSTGTYQPYVTLDYSSDVLNTSLEAAAILRGELTAEATVERSAPAAVTATSAATLAPLSAAQSMVDVARPGTQMTADSIIGTRRAPNVRVTAGSVLGGSYPVATADDIISDD